MKDSGDDLGLCLGYQGHFQPPGGLRRNPRRRLFWFLTSSTPRLGLVPGGVDDMASPQQTDLCYAWEKYMDCRLQGADLQVWLWRQESPIRGLSLGAGGVYFSRSSSPPPPSLKKSGELNTVRNMCCLLRDSHYLFIARYCCWTGSPGYHSSVCVDAQLLCYLCLNSSFYSLIKNSWIRSTYSVVLYFSFWPPPCWGQCSSMPFCVEL